LFEFRGQASLSWTLGSDELSALKSQAEATRLDPLVKAIRQWLNAGSAAAQASVKQPA